MEGGDNQNLNRLSLLKSVRIDYLVRFLKRYEVYFRSKGLHLEGVEFNASWFEHMYRLLYLHEPHFPPELFEALLDIDCILGEPEHNHFIAAATETQLDFFTKIEFLPPINWIFKTYLETPANFEAMAARAWSSESRGFIDFPAKDNRPIKSNMPNAKLRALSTQIGKWCAFRNGTSFCEVTYTRNGPELRFLLTHGEQPRTQRIIESNLQSRISYVPATRDLVILNTKTKTLSVKAESPEEQDFYRRVFGKVFFKDDDHFTTSPVYSGTPLVEKRSESLLPHGIPGLRRVLLQGLGITYKARQQRRIHYTDFDLSSLLDGPEGDEILIGSEIRYFKLALEVSLLRRSLIVEVMPPNRLDLDRRFATDMVNEFLLTRGFMHLPEFVHAG